MYTSVHEDRGDGEGVVFMNYLRLIYIRQQVLSKVHGVGFMLSV